MMSPPRFLFPLTAAVLLAGCGSSPDNGGDLIHVSCLAEPDRGPCGGAKPGFYYDYRSDSCKRFIHGGCGGRVPFATMEQCVETCGGRPAP
jgi:hypothetical protein